MIRRWQDFAQNRSQVAELFVLLFILVLSFKLVPLFMTMIEARSGVALTDFLLHKMPRKDVSYPITYILYASIGVAIVWLLSYPEKLLVMLKTTFLVTSIRLALIYLFPLEPPVDLITLSDPVLEATVYQSQKITKDLFFSGHTSSMCIMFLCVSNKYLKALLGIATLLLGFLLMVQRIHYSYDIFAAPFACYACFRIAQHAWIPEKREISY